MHICGCATGYIFAIYVLQLSTYLHPCHVWFFGGSSNAIADALGSTLCTMQESGVDLGNICHWFVWWFFLFVPVRWYIGGRLVRLVLPHICAVSISVDHFLVVGIDYEIVL